MTWIKLIFYGLSELSLLPDVDAVIVFMLIVVFYLITFRYIVRHWTTTFLVRIDSNYAKYLDTIAVYVGHGIKGGVPPRSKIGAKSSSFNEGCKN